MSRTEEHSEVKQRSEVEALVSRPDPRSFLAWALGALHPPPPCTVDEARYQELPYTGTSTCWHHYNAFPRSLAPVRYM